MKLGYMLYIHVGYYFDFHGGTHASPIQNESYQQGPKKTKQKKR